MATCNVDTMVLPDATLENSTLTITEKLSLLTEAALGSESVYMRAKDTFKELMDEKNLTQNEYAQLASQFISSLAVQTTQTVMASALEWAKIEKEMAYSLSQAKASIELTLAQTEKMKYDICNAQKDNELKCAQITATIAGSIRDNGRVATWDADNDCVPLTLQNEGTKYKQELVLEAQKYTSLADAYRKSGVVQIGVDTDGNLKGTSGDSAGYTKAQNDFALRQIKSFEDSKRSHAANATSQMIGQLLASEVAPDPTYVAQWNAAIGYLNTNTP